MKGFKPQTLRIKLQQKAFSLQKELLLILFKTRERNCTLKLQTDLLKMTAT